MTRGAMPAALRGVKAISQSPTWMHGINWMEHPLFKSTLFPATGTGQFWPRSRKSIRLCKKGCTNRPFYQVVVMETRKNQYEPVIEQVGTYDPMPNKMNQIMVSLNYERIRHWIGYGANVSKPVAELLGLSGLLPIYPYSYMRAWRNRSRMREQEKLKAEKEAAEKESAAKEEAPATS